MKIWDICLLAAAAVGMWVLGSAYIRRKYRTGKKELGYKASATLMAVIIAVLMAVRDSSLLALCLAAGTICCMTADVLLELYFIGGAAVFAIAHVCFITGFGLWEQPDGFTAVAAAVLFMGALLIFRRFISDLGKLAVPGALYIAFLSTMCAMAVNVFWKNPGMRQGAAALGGIAFMISDMVLVWNLLEGKQSRTGDKIVLGFYYSAVYLLAACRYFS